MLEKPKEKQRQRAPSKRALETRARILDAAESVFAEHGFDGASIRDIAARAGVQGALVNHHGGSKEELFFRVVARRADDLSQRRLDALYQRRAQGDLDLEGVIAAFICPFLDLVTHGEPHWPAYGRLIAHVSSDDRWRPISATCFDPTARLFMAEIKAVLPEATDTQIGAGFVFMVSAMLSVCASRWRIGDLSRAPDDADLTQTLLDFCTTGFTAVGATRRVSASQTGSPSARPTC